LPKHPDEVRHVRQVQARRRLIEQVERVPRAAARQLGSQLDALRLAAGPPDSVLDGCPNVR